LKGWERVLGLDLAGSPKRKTGYAYFDGKLRVGTLHTDEEIISLAQGFRLVMIDAPLSLPEGRESIEDKGPHYRECDLKLKSMGIRFFPISLGPMRLLTERGIRIRGELEKKGIQILETFPGGVYDRLGVKRKDKRAIRELYLRLGLPLEERNYSQDELDAIACFLVGVYHLEGRSKMVDGKDGRIFLL
jgi:predicted nuclease with RNAse H fold